jgi:hypothetical protein
MLRSDANCSMNVVWDHNRLKRWKLTYSHTQEHTWKRVDRWLWCSAPSLCQRRWVDLQCRETWMHCPKTQHHDLGAPIKGCPNVVRFLLRQPTSSHQPGNQTSKTMMIITMAAIIGHISLTNGILVRHHPSYHHLFLSDSCLHHACTEPKYFNATPLRRLI